MKRFAGENISIFQRETHLISQLL